MMTAMKATGKMIGMTMILALTLACANPACADVIGTFVDATPDNTAALDGSLAIMTVADGQADGYWWQRGGGWGQDDTSILEARYTDPINLKTVITGLTPDQEYDIYVLYSGWTAALAPQAGLSPENLAPASDSAVIHETGDPGTGGMGVLQALIGSTSADANGEIVVYIDGDPAGGRTWYDGVAFNPVPEPTVVGMLLLGAVVFRRRRK